MSKNETHKLLPMVIRIRILERRKETQAKLLQFSKKERDKKTYY